MVSQKIKNNIVLCINVIQLEKVNLIQIKLGGSIEKANSNMFENKSYEVK